MVKELILMFLLGFCYDVVVIYWTHASVVGRRPLVSAVLSMLLGAASIVGIMNAFSSTWAAGALVLGYGAGTAVVTKWLPR